MQKIRKILRTASEKTALPINHYRQHRSYRTLLTLVQQTIKEKDKGKNKEGIDPEVNKTVSCRKKWEKMLQALHKVDMRTYYTKQEINLACP